MLSFRNEQNVYDFRACSSRSSVYLEKTKMQEGRYINQNDLDNKTKVDCYWSFS